MKPEQNPAPVTPGTVTTVTRKIGSNRGKARLWIEGVALSSQGWTKGKAYQRTDTTDGRVLFITANQGHVRKVAGDDLRPIIDTNTDTILTTLGVKVGDTVTITIREEVIGVHKYNPATDDKAGAMTGKKA